MSIPNRNELKKELTWDLTPLFPDDATWEKEFSDTGVLIDDFIKYKDTLSQSAEQLFIVLESETRVQKSLERLYVYAHMKRDEDNANTLYQGMTDRAMQASSNFSAISSFISPEILGMDKTLFDSYLEEEVLAPYKRVLKNVARSRPHTLSKEEEKLIALSGEPLQATSLIFTMLNNADIKFDEIDDEDGNKAELTQENYRRFIESQNRAVRESAYRSLYKSYGALKNTLASCYVGSVKSDVFYAKARNFNSSLEAALFSGNIPVSVYDGIISAVRGKLSYLYDYLDIRRNALKLDKLSMYDLYVPIVDEDREKLDYPECFELVKEALKPLGSDYGRLLQRAYDERWVDVCENRGKTTGAYSWGAYGTHPYVLLNYQKERNYAFTLAHELGHALHSYYSDEAHPYQDAQYKIMAAEVASTVNEVLLTKYMYEKYPAKRCSILNHYLEQFRTTVFRQTMFAEFEKRTHKYCESGEPLTQESLSELYGKLNEDYYPGVLIDDEIKLEWARIPHFYRAFYVYQYATGFCCAVKIAGDILDGEPQRHLEFLKSGGSDFPINLLKRAGADLSSGEFLSKSLDEFKASADILKSLL